MPVNFTKNALFIVLFTIFALCPLSFALLTTHDIPTGDALNNVDIGWRMDDPKLEPTREPLYPFLLKQQFKLMPNAEFTEHGFKCFEKENFCPSFILETKLINWAFHALATIAAGLAVMLLTGQRGLTIIAMAALSTNATMITAVNTWLTEAPALFFLLTHSVGLYGACKLKPKWAYALMAAVTGALLILTKAIFIYLLYLYVLAAIVLLIKYRKTAAPFALLSAVMLALVLPTIINKRPPEADTYDRGAAVLAIRAEYDTMPWNQIPAAFLFFSPGGEDAVKSLYGDEVYDLFDRGSKNGYYRRVKDSKGAAYELAREKNIPVQHAALDVIRQNLVKHIVLTPVFAWQGLFIPKKVNFNNIDSKAVKIPSVIINTLLLPLCLFGAIYFIRKKRYDYLLLTVPAIYSFAIYSVATHYWPRYSLPLLGIGLVFICVLWHVRQREKDLERKTNAG